MASGGSKPSHWKVKFRDREPGLASKSHDVNPAVPGPSQVAVRPSLQHGSASKSHDVNPAVPGPSQVAVRPSLQHESASKSHDVNPAVPGPSQVAVRPSLQHESASKSHDVNPAVPGPSQVAVRPSLQHGSASKSHDVNPAVPGPSQVAVRSRLYRQALKTNKLKYKEYLHTAKIRNRVYRSQLTKEKRKEQSKKAYERVKKHREKMRQNKKSRESVETKTICTPKQNIVTRQETAEIQMKKEKERLRKQKYRANLSSQKKRRLNEKRRKKSAEKRDQINKVKTKAKDTPTSSQSTADDVLTPSQSASAKRKAASRLKNKLPKSPQKFAEAMQTLVESCTPRKRAAVDHLVITPRKKLKLDYLDSVEVNLRNTKTKREKKTLKKRRVLACYLSESQNIKKKDTKKFGVSWAYLRKCSSIDSPERKKRSDAMSDLTEKKVKDFYKSHSVSQTQPDKRFVNKNMEPRYNMERSIESAYLEFEKQNPDMSVSYSKFASLRPKHVKCMSTTKWNTCLCEYCTNIELKVKALNKATAGNPDLRHCMVKDKYEASAITLCSYEDTPYPKKSCIERNCTECGVQKMENHIQSIKDLETVSWNAWVTQSYKDKHGRDKKRKALQPYETSGEQFIRALVRDLVPFSNHLFTAQWQHEQFSLITHNVPPKTVVTCQDFGENFTCLYQDEAQSAHWAHESITIFSLVAYFCCDECEAVTHDSCVFISDDLDHDSHFVNHAVKVTVDHLIQEGVDIDQMIHFSDGAASQFKSKTPIADVGSSRSDLGFPCERNYFGSRHGKGPCDGEIGVVKRMATRAISSRQVTIRDATEMYNFAKDNMVMNDNVPPNPNGCSKLHKSRTFFYVKKEEVCRDRLDRIRIKGITGTRKLHSVRPVIDIVTDTSSVEIRNLSCFCTSCLSTIRHQPCLNDDYVETWSRQPLRQVNADGTLRTPQRGRGRGRGLLRLRGGRDPRVNRGIRMRGVGRCRRRPTRPWSGDSDSNSPDEATTSSSSQSSESESSESSSEPLVHTPVREKQTRYKTEDAILFNVNAAVDSACDTSTVAVTEVPAVLGEQSNLSVESAILFNANGDSVIDTSSAVSITLVPAVLGVQSSFCLESSILATSPGGASLAESAVDTSVTEFEVDISHLLDSHALLSDSPDVESPGQSPGDAACITQLMQLVSSSGSHTDSSASLHTAASSRPLSPIKDTVEGKDTRFWKLRMGRSTSRTWRST